MRFKGHLQAVRVTAMLTAGVLGGAIVATSALAQTDPLLDPLHGYCAGAGQCADNTIVSPTTNNPPTNFGFTVSPGSSASGTLFVDILVPNNEVVPSSFAISGTLSGTANEVSTTPWTSGNLTSYLGLPSGVNPSNPIGSWLPSTQAVDPGATGYFVFQADLGSTTLLGPSSPNVSPLENLSTDLGLGSLIVGFLNTGTNANPNWISTAQSGAIFEGGTPTPVPEPASLAIIGTALVGFGVIRRRRKTV